MKHGGLTGTKQQQQRSSSSYSKRGQEVGCSCSTSTPSSWYLPEDNSRTMEHPTTSCSTASFPFLTPEEFHQACRALVDSVDTAGGPQTIGWHLMELSQQSRGIAVLRIVKRMLADGADNHDGDGTSDSDTHTETKDHEIDGEIDEIDDPEALDRQPCPTAQVEVEYNIIRSAIYQLPVLYFFLRSIPSHGPQGIDAVYRYLVPKQLRTVLGSVGVMGGISIEYHPTLGVPVYFVHPCNTGDALRDVADGRVPTVESYLPLWLGLVGNCVNLHLPSELLVCSNARQT